MNDHLYHSTTVGLQGLCQGARTLEAAYTRSIPYGWCLCELLEKEEQEGCYEEQVRATHQLMHHSCGDRDPPRQQGDFFARLP